MAINKNGPLEAVTECSIGLLYWSSVGQALTVFIVQNDLPYGTSIERIKFCQFEKLVLIKFTSLQEFEVERVSALLWFKTQGPCYDMDID